MYKYISSAGDRNEVLNGTSGRLAAVGAIIERLGKKGDPLARSLARDYLAHVETVSDHTREKKYYYKQPTLLIGAAGAFQGICLDQKDKDLSIMVLKDFITDHHGDNPHTRDWALDQLFILNDKEAVAIAKKLFLIEESWYRSRMHKLSIIIMGDGLENSEINTAISFIEIFLLEKYLKQTFSEFDFPADSDALFYALTSLTFISPEKYKKLIGLLKRAWVRHEAEKQTPPLLFGSSRIFNIDALFSYLMSRI
jgi:hypothetical protein